MKRSKFNLSNYKLFTADMGQLVPVGMQEVLPGDTFQQNTSLLLRVSPLIAPVMHPVTVRIHHWFVPNRLLWDGWEDFITGESDDIPPGTSGYPNVGELYDYLGVPTIGIAGERYLQFPQLAYNLIFNEFYRDQDLVPERTSQSGDSATVANIAWEKDNFTSARPWPQKGSQVTIPLGDKVPVTGLWKDNQAYQTGPGEGDLYGSNAQTIDSSSIRGQIIGEIGSDGEVIIQEDPDNPGFPGIYADLSQAEAVDVNEFRKAFALQRYQEARARYGSRYTEYLQYLGIRPADSRLQRPEYLGGGKSNISFSEILQTAPDDSGQTLGVGDLYGHGIAALRTNNYRKFFQEHGLVMTLMSVRPKTIYQDGLPRYYSKNTKEDFYQKELQHIGQQEVLNSEVWCNGDPEDSEVFGYQDRYYEYKTTPSSVAGEFRDVFDYWHMARKFDSRPALNESFVTCDPTKRIHAVSDNNVLWCMAHHNIRARRLVKKSPASLIL